MTPLINWIDAKYLKEELPKTQSNLSRFGGVSNG